MNKNLKRQPVEWVADSGVLNLYLKLLIILIKMLNLKFKNSKWQPVEWVADCDILNLYLKFLII